MQWEVLVPCIFWCSHVFMNFDKKLLETKGWSESRLCYSFVLGMLQRFTHQGCFRFVEIILLIFVHKNLRTLKLLRGLSLSNHWCHYDITALVEKDLHCLLVTGFLVPVLRCLKDQRPRSGLGGNLVQSSCYLLSSLWRFSWYTELALPNEIRWVWPAPLTIIPITFQKLLCVPLF